MKEVKINVYEFEELPEPVQKRVLEQERDFLIESNFSAFEEYEPEYLRSIYHFPDVQIGYSLTYCQGDGFHFQTKAFLTDITLPLIQAKCSSDEARKMAEKMYHNDLGFNYSTAIVAEKDVRSHYEYASKYDILLGDNYFSDSTNYNVLDADIIEQVLTAAQEVYLEICKEAERVGYSQYDVKDADAIEAASNYYYYENGEVYGDIDEEE